MSTSPRRRIEAILLATIGILSVVPLRIFVESSPWLFAELAAIAILAALRLYAGTREQAAGTATRESGTARKPTGTATKPTGTIRKPAGAPVQADASVPAESAATRDLRISFACNGLSALLMLSPILVAIAARAFGAAVPFEMTALSAFGAAALSIAISAKTDRTRSMSLVASGFLVLFATAISDSPRAAIIAIVWMTGCVWHLVANHWERLEVCLADSVRPTVVVRPLTILAAVVLCVLGGWAAHDRFGDSQRFTGGFMPTSGGSKWSDPAARSGVGSGDAAIAAKDHAESFGAVESDLFLETTQSTLFDMFTDSIGEPKRRKVKREFRQGLAPEKLIETHEKTVKSEQGSSSFTTDRMPPKKHRHFKDATQDAVVQWDGPTGIRLAMHRYDTFDGVQWSNQGNHAVANLTEQSIRERPWFFDPDMHDRINKNSDSVQVNLLKVLRLDSTRIPTPMMTAGLHIKDIIQRQFFGIDPDGTFFMPGREKIPPLTVVNIASMSVMEDELLEQVPAYEQLRQRIQKIRTEFVFDRGITTEGDVPLDEFIRTRRGGDHLFATYAAMQARELGLRSRLVTGFYVRPDAFEYSAGHANVTADDVHVWVEIQMDDGRWFEIEPTPGYLEPVYQPSLFLRAKRMVAAYWLHAVVVACVLAMLYATRLIWVEWLLTLGWSLTWPLSPKRQLSIAMRIIECRAGMLGKPRPIGKPQRDWVEALSASDATLRTRVAQYCDAADRVVFGGGRDVDRESISRFVRGLSSTKLRRSLGLQ
ncbi:MAG: transglutaminase-like domain-containing protein [Planctomycetota bacterium]